MAIFPLRQFRIEVLGYAVSQSPQLKNTLQMEILFIIIQTFQGIVVNRTCHFVFKRGQIETIVLRFKAYLVGSWRFF